MESTITTVTSNTNVSLEMFNLLSVIKEVIHETSMKAKIKQIKVISQWESGLDEIYFGDKLKIRTIISNILYNSIERSRYGDKPAIIRVNLCKSDNLKEKLSNLRIIIEDHGIGFTTSELDSIFTFPFFFLRDNHVKLRNAKLFVESLNENFSINSIPSYGTSILFHLHLESRENTIIQSNNQLENQYDKCANQNKEMNQIQHNNRHIQIDDMDIDVDDDIYNIDDLDSLDDQSQQTKLTNDSPTSYSTSPTDKPNTPPPFHLDISKSKYETPIFISSSLQSCNGKALLVDDCVPNRKVLARLLNVHFGYHIDHASDGYECIDKVRNAELNCFSYDIILLDNHMPRLCGTDAIKFLRESMKYEGTVIGLTAMALKEDLEYFRQCGCDDVLIKPLNVTKFRAFLSEYTINSYKM